MRKEYIPIWEYVKLFFCQFEMAGQRAGPQPIEASRTHDGLTGGMALRADTLFKIFVQVLSHGAQWSWIVL
jgi:hypothetical protein